MERRRFLGWVGSAGLAALWMASGGSPAEGQSAAKPPEPAAPATPPADQPPGPDAHDLASIAKRRYGAHLDDPKLDELTKALDRGLQGSAALRKAKLANGDEPDFIFFPRQF
jgi:hypothetical protein